MKRLTTAEFIEKAKAVHGDRYDYSLVEYLGSRKPVTIICPDHSSFPQRPSHHLANHGCPDCGGTKKSTTDRFIEKAKAKHGDRYDYSQVEYVSKDENVTIICRNHDRFIQSPHNHLAGQGCPDCGMLSRILKQRFTTDEFIEKARAIHGDQFDYSKVEYVNTSTNVTIICSDHGRFQQTPNAHLAKKGCPDCAGKNVTTESFIEKAKAKHDDRYDYSQVNYVSAVAKVTIRCPEHDAFEQTPNTHLSGRGCPKCGDVASAMAKRLTKEQFIDRAKAVHGNRYDYSHVEYVAAIAKVKINCPDHGAFEQSPTDHINQTSGCPDCAETGFNPNDRGTLYYLAITTDVGNTRYKIGITNRTVEKRFRAPDLARIRIVKTWKYAVGRVAAEREAEILRLFAGDRYCGPDILQTGNTELFTHDVLGLDK